ncbi:MAG: hypothetical protein PGN37_20465 [Mycobacterium kyogaense]|uniref:hypothetical protein n=1 Tax=Mycobacterium kyogaense TaxID=2212479 RepID=UPI002FFA6D00
MYESSTVRSLRAGRDTAWAALQPAFDHAIALAKEAEYQADRAANEVQQHCPAAYPPLVELLAASVPDAGPSPAEVPF